MEASSVVLCKTWSSIWDAARYMGHPPLQKPAFPLSLCKTQLDVAAQAVVRIRESVEGGRMETQDGTLPLEGRSKALLEMAVDGLVDVLPMPFTDPLGFVRGLVHAAFQTGDGEYSLGVTDKAALDALLQQGCEDLMDVARKLLTPIEAAKEVDGAIADLSAATKSLVDLAPSVAPNSANAVAFGNGIGQLRQEMCRLVQQARDLADMPACLADSQAVGTDDVEMKDDRPSDDIVFENISEAAGDTEEQDAPLERTKSQVVKRLNVDEVGKMIEERKEPVQNLQRALSKLERAEEGAESDTNEDYDKKLDALHQVDKLQKSFRGFGEDLMEGMLSLDGISGLSDEDRVVKKNTLREVQELLDKIDSAKPRVAKIQKRLTTEVEQLKPPSETAAPEAAAAKSEEAEAPSKAPTLSQPQVDWSKVKLSAKFTFQEKPRFYILAASMPGLDAESIHLSRQENDLAIEGMRVPTGGDQRQMNNSLRQHIQRLSSQERAQVTQEDVDQWMLQLGHGRFGRFMQEYSLPADVDWESIRPSYEDGVLRIILPRKATKPRTARGPRGPYPGHRRGGYGMPDLMW